MGGYCVKCSKVTFFTGFIAIYLLGIFRAELLGVDVGNYRQYYFWYGEETITYILSRWRTIDVGYYFIGKIIYILGLDFYQFKCVIYSIVWCLVGMTISKESKFPAFSFLVLLSMGFLGLTFVILRQSIAAALCFCAYRYMKEKNLRKFLFLVFLATLFHRTAIFVLMIYFFVNVSFKGKAIWNRGILIIMAYLLGMGLMPILINIYMHDYSSAVVRGDGIFALFFYFTIYVINIFTKRTITEENEKKRNLEIEDRVSWGVICMQVEATLFSLWARIVNYYTSFYALTIPTLFARKKSNRKYFYIYLIMFSFMYIYSLFSNSAAIVPYKSIWSM